VLITSQAVVTVRDKGRLIDTIRRGGPWSDLQARHLGSLDAMLRRAELVLSHDVPSDVVTMNSRFQLRDIGAGEEMGGTYALVYPSGEPVEATPLCVVSPQGLSFLGARVGDVIRWNDGGRWRRSEVARIVYQPEAAGHF
jgi:regulator of nucleoside diphosphate kinase